VKHAISLIIFGLLNLIAEAQNDAIKYYLSAEKKSRAGCHLGALEDYRKALSIAPGEWAHYNYGHCRYNIHDFAGAITEMDSVLAINPENPLALGCKGASERELKMYAESLKDLDHSISLAKNDTTFFNRALLKFSMKDTAGALTDCDNFLKLNPALTDYVWRARLKSNIGDFNGAINDYISARSLISDSNDYYIELNFAHTLMMMKNFEGSLSAYNKLLARYPHKAEVLVNRGKTEEEMGHKTNALKDYRHAIKYEPLNPLGYNAKARLRYNESAYMMSITDFTQALRLDPKNAETYVFRGIAKHFLERDAQAIRDFSRAIKLYPNYAIAYRRRGDSEKMIGRNKEAGADYFKATQLGSARE